MEINGKIFEIKRYESEASLKAPAGQVVNTMKRALDKNMTIDEVFLAKEFKLNIHSQTLTKSSSEKNLKDSIVKKVKKYREEFDPESDEYFDLTEFIERVNAGDVVELISF